MNNIPTHIISGCRSADRASQKALYEHCYADMMKVCLRYCGADEDAAAVYNEAMFKVFSSIRQYREEGAAAGWIRRIVVNTCADHCRKAARFALHPVSEPREEDHSIAPEIYDKIDAEAAWQLVKELPANTALVFNLFVIEGYGHEEIGKMIGIATGTSKWHLNEARRLLKIKLTALSKSKIYSHVS